MDLATSGKGGIGTFIGICIVSGVFGISDAHVQGGMVGDLSYMLPEFIQVNITNEITAMWFKQYLQHVHSFNGFIYAVFPRWFCSVRGHNIGFEVNYKSSI